MFHKTVDCFLLNELQNPKTEIDYFTSSKNTLPVVVQRLTETMSHVVLILFSIAVSHEWKNMLFFNMTKIRKNVKKLPVVNFENYSTKVRVTNFRPMFHLWINQRVGFY